MTVDQELDEAAQELQRAREARQKGNEGMARVCARRAAGKALGPYALRRSHHDWGPAAFDRLKRIQSEPGVPAAVRAAAQRLTARITQDHVLPHPEDPIEDASTIIRFASEAVRTERDS